MFGEIYSRNPGVAEPLAVFLNIVYIIIKLRDQRVPNYGSSTSYRVPHVVGIKTRDINFQILPKLISLDVIIALNHS